MSAGVLVLGETLDGALRASTREAIGAGQRLAQQGAGPLAVALIDPDPEAHVQALSRAGVEEVVLVRSPRERFEAHVSETALGALVAERAPAVVLLAHTLQSFGFAAAVAARAGHGFAGDVVAARWGEEGLLAQRPAYGGRLLAELDFPARETVVLALRPGAFPAAEGAGEGARETRISRPEIDLTGAPRSEHVGLRAAQSGEVDIGEADFLVAVGRAIGDGRRAAELEALARRMGATLAASGPPVEAGWVARTRKVGQSGRTVAPRVYLALGISGAPQHLAGMSKAGMIIAVNTDRGARIFDVAHHGAVADLFEVAAELERLFG